MDDELRAPDADKLPLEAADAITRHTGQTTTEPPNTGRWFRLRNLDGSSAFVRGWHRLEKGLRPADKGRLLS